MVKYCLVVKEGLAEKWVFPLEDSVTIGRESDNDIRLLDQKVSRKHAAIYRSEGQIFAEDLSSQNGTFVNGQRIQKVDLSVGDTISIGGIVLLLLDREEASAKISLAETMEFAPLKLPEQTAGSDSGQLSNRALEALSKIPIFSNLDDESLAYVSRTAALLVYNRGATIIRQGDTDKSLYIVLEGKVRISTRDGEGKEIRLGIRSENSFFGASSLLTGEPQKAAVRALEETSVCRISSEIMQELFHRFPPVKTQLERDHRLQLREAERQKQKTGFVGRRRGPHHH